MKFKIGDKIVAQNPSTWREPRLIPGKVYTVISVDDCGFTFDHKTLWNHYSLQQYGDINNPDNGLMVGAVSYINEQKLRKALGLE